MIKLILGFLDAQLANWPVNFLGLAELQIKNAQDTSIQFPVIYKGKGNPVAVNKMKHVNGWIYHRNTGFSEEDVERGTGKPRIERSYQLITVAMVRKNALGDTVFTPSEFGEILSSQISKTFYKDDNLLSRTFVNDTNYSSFEVHGLEFQGIDYFVPADMVMIRINWTAKFIGDVDCFPTKELC